MGRAEHEPSAEETPSQELASSEERFLQDVANASTELSAEGGPSQMPHPGQVVDGKYRLGAMLGHGGMGWVFEAVHLQTKKAVALKYLRGSLRLREPWLERFVREARAAGRIDHPNVIRVYDLGGRPPDVYIVMERLRGQTLRDRLRQGRLPVTEALALFEYVLRGVGEAHRMGVVHGDIKPENVFLTVLGDGTPHEPKVLDFGVSQFETASLDGVSGLGGAAWAAGTPCYMPLEQLHGEALDVRADVHALGVMLYEMLAGELPRRSRDRSRLIEELERDDPPALRLENASLAARLDAVVARTLAQRPADRYQSVAELAAALGRATVEPAPEQRAEAPRRAWPVRGALAALALVGVLALLTATLLRARDGAAASTLAAPRVPHATLAITTRTLTPARARDQSSPAAAPTRTPEAPTTHTTAARAPVGDARSAPHPATPHSAQQPTLEPVAPRAFPLHKEDF
jgi:serine/threonine-protein kinase